MVATNPIMEGYPIKKYAEAYRLCYQTRMF